MKKIALEERSVKGAKLAAGETITVGIDAHQGSWDVAYWSDGCGCVIRHFHHAGKMADLVKKLKGIKDHISQVVYEAGPTGYGLVRALRADGMPAEVVAPSKMPRMPVPGAKSDRTDSIRLAGYASKGMVGSIVHVPSEEEEADRQVVRTRQQFVEKKNQVKIQIKSFLRQHGISYPEGLEHWSKAAVAELSRLDIRKGLRVSLSAMICELEHLEGVVKELTDEIEAMLRSKRYEEKGKRLMKIGGVGLVTAMTYMTEMHSPERFREAAQVARMTGLAPEKEKTGMSERDVGLVDDGNRHLKRVLVEAAWRWAGKDAAARGVYERLKRNTGNGRKAIVGVARRLGMVMWKMLVTGEEYRGYCVSGAGPVATSA